MADIVLKDRGNEAKTYAGAESVELLDADGNEVEFYEGSKFENYYTKSETYSQKQVDSAIGKAVLSSQADWACDDAGNSLYVRNRTHFDSRKDPVSFVVDAESDTVSFQGVTLRKISDEVLTSTTELSGTTDASTVQKWAEDTTVTLKASDGAVYGLNWYAVSALYNALSTMPSGHIFQAWAYCKAYESDGNQEWIDDTKRFYLLFCFVREGNKLTLNDAGTAETLDSGTYVAWFDGSATDVAGATATITYGRLQKLDGKYLDLSGLYTKAEVDAIVKKAIQSVLPAYTSADNGKVLGVQNGKLAWVKVETSTDPDPGEETTVELVSVGSAVQSGDYVEIT